MHILIDVQGYQSESKFRGIGRSTLAMSRAIIKNAGEHRVSILINGMFPLENVEDVKNSYRDILPEQEMFVFSGWGPTAYREVENHARYQAASQVRDVAIANINPDVVFVISLFEGYDDDYTVSVPAQSAPWKTVVVCHDLIPLLNKERYLCDPNYHRFYMDKLTAFEHADAVFAISNSSADEVRQYTKVPAERITNISSAVGDEFGVRAYGEQELARLQQQYRLPEQFVLTLAMIEPRKNIEALIHAYSLLPDELQRSYPLVLAYKVRPDDLERIYQLADNYRLNRDRLIFTGYLPDDDLIALYNLCKLFVFPSLHEGFGLPVLEAMKCGAATLTSNVTSLPEVAGWEQATFDPYSVQDINASLNQALTDNDFWLALKRHALEQAGKFSWDNTARAAIAGFDRLLENRDAKEQDAAARIAKQVMKSLRKQSGLNDVDRLGLAWGLARNGFGTQRRKLLVDISVLAEHDAKTGIQRVSRSILNALLSHGVAGYDVRAVRYRQGDCYRYANQFVKRSYGQDFGDDDPVLFTKDDILLVTDLTCHLFPWIEAELDVLRRVGAKAYFVVHDIMPVNHPEWSDENIQRLFPTWLSGIAWYANGIVCVSAHVANEVRGWLRANAHQVRINPQLTVDNFHLGADIDSSLPSTGLPDNGPALLEQMEREPSFIMVGTMEPRKGHAQVVQAFEQLWAQGKNYNLFIVGKQGWNVEALCERLRQHPQAGRRLVWLQNISDEFLNLLYERSRALIFASQGEGFGLPLIEAAQKGLPLILRRLPVFEEIAGNYAFYFDGQQPEDLAQALERWLELYQQGRHPSTVGMPWLTWRQSAELLLSKLPLIAPEKQ